MIVTLYYPKETTNPILSLKICLFWTDQIRESIGIEDGTAIRAQA